VVNLQTECRDGIQEKLLSPSELARVLGFSNRTINRMARRGEIPGTVFIGAHVRFKPEAVADFIERGGAVQIGGVK
jgi:excisionase family DNA binding protein